MCLKKCNILYCGGACTPHLPGVSCHCSLVVKCFASGQCGPGSIPGWCRNWSQCLQFSMVAPMKPAQSTLLSNLDALGEPCGVACTPHLRKVSCHCRLFLSALLLASGAPDRSQAGAEVGANSKILHINFLC